MSTDPTGTRRAYGWRDFDQEVVEGLVENDSRFINRRSNGWILSPLLGHYDTRLAWKDDNYKKGSVPAGDPPVSFRAALSAADTGHLVISTLHTVDAAQSGPEEFRLVAANLGLLSAVETLAAEKGVAQTRYGRQQ